MASIKKRTAKNGKPRYDVRYRTPAGKVRTKTFTKSADATKFANTTEADKARGEWLDPLAGRESFEEWADRWTATTSHLRPSTRRRYSTALAHIVPVIGDTPISKIDHAAILGLVSDLLDKGLSPGSVRQARQVMRSVFELARRSDAIRSNPVLGVKVQGSRSEEMVFLNASQVAELAEAIEHPPIKTGGGERRRATYPEYGLLVRFAAYTGLRAGEIAGLRVGRLNLLRRRVDVVETLSEAGEGGSLYTGPTKTYERRSVPIPSGMIDELAAHVAGRSEDAYVFTAPNGGPLRHRAFYGRHFKPAVRAADTVPDRCRFHDLRHSYAALLAAQSAPPLAIMRRMGHSSIQVTLGTYGHLFPEIEERIDDGLDDAYRGATPAPSATVTELEPRDGRAMDSGSARRRAAS